MKIPRSSARTAFGVTCLPLIFFLASSRNSIATTGSLNAPAILTDTVPPADAIFEKVDKEAYFPGGEEGWRAFLGQNLNPNTPAENSAPAGRYTVIIQFVVDTSGRLSAFRALTKFGYGMEAEVMRILRKSPPWVPAVQDGHKVRAYRQQPVTFVLEVEKGRKKRRG